MQMLRFFGLMAISLQSWGEVSLDEFTRLHREIQPGTEAWEEIPWHNNLISAQHEAARAGKPLFIWAMDGHPLGCT